MFNYGNVHTVVFNITDPAASVTLPFFTCPSRDTYVEILQAFVSCDTLLASGTTNGRQVNLVNMGTAGTATTVISSVAGSATGGTYSAWVANTPRALTLTAGTVLASQYVGLQYAEAGTDAFKNLTVVVHYTVGKGS
jgi:hypothetical protein